jgi:hypothetical protein
MGIVEYPEVLRGHILLGEYEFFDGYSIFIK